jgi:hypothetical protein
MSSDFQHKKYMKQGRDLQPKNIQELHLLHPQPLLHTTLLPWIKAQAHLEDMLVEVLH